MKLPASFDETVSFLKGFNALEEGHFLLASGRHSGHYVQKTRLVERPDVVAELIRSCRAEIDAAGKPDVVLSPAMGGVPVGQQAGYELECRHIYSERTADNEMVLKRGFKVARGEKVLLVEDVITTGGTLLELKGFLEEQGAEVVGVFCLVNRSGSDRWQEVPLIAPLKIVFPTYEASEVPDELAAIPLVRPGSKKV